MCNQGTLDEMTFKWTQIPHVHNRDNIAFLSMSHWVLLMGEKQQQQQGIWNNVKRGKYNIMLQAFCRNP